MTDAEKKEELRQSLKSKLHAARINRMDKRTRQSALEKLQKQVQAEVGQDYDLKKVMNCALHKGVLDGEKNSQK